ncbi:MAG: biotin/lipoyl-containing protein [Oscillospiraceae bacterium]
MKFIVTLNGKDYEVEVEQNSANVLSVSDAAAKKAAPAPVASVAAPAPVAAPKPAPAAPAAPAAPVAGTPISAPMPGTILKILVTAGQQVKRGDAVLVLEAMKMENEIYAAEAGTIKQITTTVGAAVSSGDVLIVMG